MYNNARPNAADLPSARKLIRSTLIALVIAATLLVTTVLPAEYAIDPTGIGRLLGLTEMGEIKAQLAKEAAADAASNDTAGETGVTSDVVAAPAPSSAGRDDQRAAHPASVAAIRWRDEKRVVLQPGEGAEIKLVMKQGEQAHFSWKVRGGTVNFDTHGDGSGQATSYEKGRGVGADEGVLVAAFDGNHGWFWRNRGTTPVTVVLRVRGEYAAIKRLV
jgi:hypothetical protein